MSAAIAGSLALLARTRRPPVVLCYHGVGPTPADGDPHGLFVSESTFAGQLDVLLDRGYALVTASELWAAVAERGPAGARGLAAVTLDDGLAASVATASRLLDERGGRGTAYLLPALLGGRHPDLPGHDLLDEGGVRALVAGPLEIGSHGLAHSDLRTLDADAARHDLRESRRALEALSGRRVASLAYPFGRYTAETTRLAAEVGYDHACACSGAGPWRRYEVPREAVFPTTTPARLRAKLLGLNGPLAGAAGAARRLRR